MRGRKVVLTLAAAGMAVSMALPSQAARFRADFFGEVDFAAVDSANVPFNSFDLSVGDLVTGFAIYDTNALQTRTTFDFFDASFTPVSLGLPGTGLWQTISVGPATTTFSLGLNIGVPSVGTFTEADDLGFAFGFPELWFLDGNLVGFDFFGENAAFSSFESFMLDYLFPNYSSDPNDLTGFATGSMFFAARDPGFEPIEGFFTFPPDLVRPVDNNNNIIPEPGTMLLLGSGLLGLARYGRKRYNV